MADLLLDASYRRKVLSLGPVAYWPLWDPTGAANAGNLVGSDSPATSVTFGAAGIGDGLNAGGFDGVNDFVNINAAVSALFSAAAGTVLVWGRASGAGVWTDGGWRTWFYLGVDVNNYVRLGKTSGNALAAYYKAGGTSKYLTKVYTGLDMMAMMLTWDVAGDVARMYWQSEQNGANLTSLGTWAGSLGAALCCIGAESTGPVKVWSGELAHVALWDRALSVGEAAYVGRL